MRVYLCLFVLATSLFSSSVWSASFSLKANEAGLEIFLDEVIGHVPAKMAAGIGAPVQIKFESLDSSTSISVDCSGATQPQKLARVELGLLGKPKRPFTIVLHKNLLKTITDGEVKAATFPCGHKNLYRLALATVLHELSHLYDFSDNLLTKEDQFYLERCEDAKRNGEEDSALCTHLNNMVGKISERRSYKNFTGFVSTDGASKNKNTARSADPYEHSAVREHFAVNMEYFLLDKEFRCRRPALFARYSQEFGLEPYGKEACMPNADVIGSSTGLIANLDPKRAYQVQYLFASKGKQLMSRWGHAMLRVVMCAPERKVVGPDCLQDVAHHVVISYRANIEGPMISYWNGLTGKYPSQLLILSMGEVVDEYTRKEMRELISLPLKITEQQKELLIYQALEQFWGYSGKYYFLSNNCASEMDQLIKGVIGEYHEYQDRLPMSPLGVYQYFELDSLVDLSLLQDREQAIRKGHYFPSQRGVLERALAMIGVSEGLDEFLENSSALERRELFLKSRVDKKVAAAFYLLEKAAQRNLDTYAQKSSTKMVLEYENEGKKQGAPVLDGLLERLAKIRESLLPWKIMKAHAGYGVPLPNELISRDEFVMRVKSLVDLMQELGEQSEQAQPALHDEQNTSRENLKLFSAGMNH